MRAAHAGPVLRGQRFADEQILRGPVVAARKGSVQACLQGTHFHGLQKSPHNSQLQMKPHLLRSHDFGCLMHVLNHWFETNDLQLHEEVFRKET